MRGRPTNMPSTCQATVFYDEVGEASARLYALAAPTIDDRLLTVDELAQCRFDCRVEGPTCRYSTTLQSRITLKHRGVTTWGDIPAVMAEGILPDPCPWSSELPFLYRVIGTVRIGERSVAEINQTFGIRPLSTVLNRFVLNGKKWVPRIIQRSLVTPGVSIAEWRDAAATMYIVGDKPDVFAEASEFGVPVMVMVPWGGGSPTAALNLLRDTSRYPAVVLAELETDRSVPDKFVSAARNTLLLRWGTKFWPWEDSEDQQVDRAHGLVFVPDVPPAELPSIWKSGKPAIAFQQPPKQFTLADARAECDTLQRNLAGTCDPAGYMV